MIKLSKYALSILAFSPLYILAHPAMEECCALQDQGGFIRGDFLYWTSQSDNLEYATAFENAQDFELGGTVRGKTKNLEFDWSPGFRVGAGYRLEQAKNGYLQFLWTSFRGKGEGFYSTNGDSTQSSMIQWLPLVLGDFASQAKAKWFLDYNTLDLEGGIPFIIRSGVHLTPFLGIKAAWINQSYKPRYIATFNANADSGGTFPLFAGDTYMLAHNNFFGAGIRAGGQLKYSFTNNFNIWGSLAGSLLYGRFNQSQKYTGYSASHRNAPQVTLRPIILRFAEKYFRVRPDLELALGLGWRCFFDQQKRCFTLNLGYEMTEWFNQTELYHYTNQESGSHGGNANSDARSGNLSLQGLTVDFGFDF